MNVFFPDLFPETILRRIFIGEAGRWERNKVPFVKYRSHEGERS